MSKFSFPSICQRLRNIRNSSRRVRATNINSSTPAVEALESRQMLTAIAVYDFGNSAGDGDFDNPTFESVDTDSATTASSLANNGFNPTRRGAYISRHPSFSASESGGAGFMIANANQGVATNYVSFTVTPEADASVTYESFSVYHAGFQPGDDYTLSLYVVDGNGSPQLLGEATFTPSARNESVTLLTFDFDDFDSSNTTESRLYVSGLNRATQPVKLDDISLEATVSSADPTPTDPTPTDPTPTDPTPTDGVIAELTVISLNLDSSDNRVDPWEDRVDTIADLFVSHEADIIGVQEMLVDMTADFQADLEAALPDNYAFITFDLVESSRGVNVNQNAIIYNQDRFTYTGIGGIEVLTFEATGPREFFVTWAYLQDESGEVFAVYNTHFDFGSADARNEHAQALVDLIDQNAATFGEVPVIFTGDLNINDERPTFAGSTDEDTIEILQAAGLVDTFLPDEGSIDWVFASEDWSIVENAMLDNDAEHGSVSDHIAVITSIQLDLTPVAT